MTILFGVLVGLALGVTGGGGSIFGIPLLIYGLGVAPKSAVAVSLGAVAITSAFGAGQGMLRRGVDRRAGLILAVAGMAAAPLGVFIGDQVSGSWVLFSFAGLLVIVALRMAWQARCQRGQADSPRVGSGSDAANDRRAVCRYGDDGRLRLNPACSARLVAAGVIVGVLAGFFGVGGGFLIVPALLLITEMGIHRAVTTSLLVIALIGLSGLVSAVVSGREIDWVLTGLFTAGGVVGMFVGRALARYLAGPTLQLVFSIAMIATAVFIVVERLSSGS